MSVRAGKSFDKLLDDPNWKDRALKAEKQLEAVREYAAHKPYCTWFEGDRFVNRVCDCGLTAAIGEVKS